MAESNNEYAKIVAKAWSDEDFHKRLVNDPEKTLRDEGWKIDSRIKVKIAENSDTHTLTLGLPSKPQGLSDEQLRDRAEGSACCTGAPCC